MSQDELHEKRDGMRTEETGTNDVAEADDALRDAQKLLGWICGLSLIAVPVLTFLDGADSFLHIFTLGFHQRGEYAGIARLAFGTSLVSFVGLMMIEFVIAVKGKSYGSASVLFFLIALVGYVAIGSAVPDRPEAKQTRETPSNGVKISPGQIRKKPGNLLTVPPDRVPREMLYTPPADRRPPRAEASEDEKREHGTPQIISD